MDIMIGPSARPVTLHGLANHFASPGIAWHQGVTRIRSPAMSRFSYRERDYAFGQQWLTLRTTIGMTQVGLAEYLGVSRQAVGDWEAGSSYPKAEHLKAFITLAVQHRAFHAHNEADEIRILWKAAH